MGSRPAGTSSVGLVSRHTQDKMSMCAATQSSRTPYDHLRYKYPGTWKRLVEIMDNSGAPVAVATKPTDLQPGNSYSGFSVTGPHTGPKPRTPPSVQKSMSDPAL